MTWPRHFSPDGATDHERSELLLANGPKLRVILRNPFAPEIAENINNQVVADAIIDTGASCICVDKTIAHDLKLQRSSPANIIAVGVSHSAWRYRALVEVPEVDFRKIMEVCAPNKATVAPRILLGRSFLQHYVFTINGFSGVCTMHNGPNETISSYEEFDG